MKSREQSFFAGCFQKQNRTQLAIILGVAGNAADLILRIILDPRKTRTQVRAVLLLFQKLSTGSNWKRS